MEVSQLPPAHIPQTSPTVWADNDTCCTFSLTMTAVRQQAEKRPRATQWMSVRRIKTSTCTLPQHCSKPAISERARDSTASRQAEKNEEIFLKSLHRLKMGKGENIMSITSTHLVYWNDFKRRISLLTMRKGTATHSFIEYCHKKHVTVFEVRFHFVNGLNPEEKDHFTP